MQTESCSYFDSESTVHEYETLGLSESARLRLANLSGVPPTLAFLSGPRHDGRWQATSELAPLLQKRPLLISTTWRAADPDNEAHTLHQADGVWLDIDASPKRGETIVDAIEATRATRDMLQKLDIDPETCNLFASGGKGFHAFVPLALLIEGGATAGLPLARHFPRICKAFVSRALVTDLTDLTIYSGGQGRLLKQAGVQRENGAYKVPVRWGDLDGMTLESYRTLCSKPGAWIEAAPVLSVAAKAASAWARAYAEVIANVGGVRAPGTRLAPGGTMARRELKRIGSALHSVDATAYEDWLNVGMALHSTGAPEALELWDDWSRKAPNYSAPACAAKWNSFTEGKTGGVTLGTVFHLAKSAGWNDETRPVVKVSSDVEHMTDDARRALADPEIGIFEQSGRLVEIVTKRSAPEDGREVLQKLDKARARAVLSTEIDWLKRDGRHKAEIGGQREQVAWGRASPPDSVIDNLLASKSFHPVPALRGLLQVPAWVREVGVVQKPGYEPKSGYYLVEPSGGWLNTDGRPTKADALAALRRLRTPFAEFDWASGATDLDSAPSLDEAVWLAALLTAVQRPTLSTAPAFGISATTRGSGKTLLARCLGALMLGTVSVPMMAGVSTDEAEATKTIVALASAGAALLVFDDCTVIPNIAPLRSLLTNGVVSGRELGFSRTIEAPSAALAVFTGNNLAPPGDMVRRFLLLTLDPRCETPETRDGFAVRDLVGYVLLRRREIVRDILTIVVAYQTAGCPNRKTLGSFEQWSSQIVGALCWVDCPDVTAAQPKDVDPERSDIGELAAAFCEDIGVNEGAVALKFMASDECPNVQALLRRRHPRGYDGIDELRAGRWLASSVHGLPVTAISPSGSVPVRFMARKVNGKKGWRLETLH